MKKLKIVFLLAGLIGLALWLAGCTPNAPATTEPAAPATTYTVSNDDGSVTAEITWNGAGSWTGNTNPVIEGTPCAQLVGTQMHFFYGMTKIAVEELQNGASTGQLVLEPGWTITSTK